jgi:hypothetical protein
MAAKRESRSFLSRASVERLRGEGLEGPLVRWEGMAAFGLGGGESMAGNVRQEKGQRRYGFSVRG